MSACVCCRRPADERNPRVTRGRIHFDCWNEHHSDPSEVWPPSHECDVDRDPEEFCPDCFAGMESSQHHEKCVAPLDQIEGASDEHRR